MDNTFKITMVDLTVTGNPNALSLCDDDLQNIMDNPMPEVQIRELQSGLWEIEIEGPANSSFDGQTLIGRVCFHEQYPGEPPLFAIQPPVQHININPTTGLVNPELFASIWTSSSNVSNCIQILLDTLECPRADLAFQDTPKSQGSEKMDPNLLSPKSAQKDKLREKSMSDSPLINPEIRAYMRKNEIESVLSKMVNAVAREIPEDCYGFMASFLGGLSPFPPLVTGIEAREIVNEAGPTISMSVIGDIRGIKLVSPSYTLSYAPEGDNLFDEEEDRFAGKGMRQAAEILSGVKVENITATSQHEFDSLIRQASDKQNVQLAGSFAFTKGSAYFMNLGVHEYLQKLVGFKEENKSRIMFKLFKCGRLQGTRAKFAGFNIYEAEPGRIPADKLSDVTTTIYEVAKKIVSGGRGDAKFAATGEFVAPYEAILEAIKYSEEIITQSGFKPNEDFKIYIECNADDFWTSETERYEMETFKAPIEAPQLIDYYIKLMNDKPSIGMLEDPLATEDAKSYGLLFEKIDREKIAINRLVQNDLTLMNEFIYAEPVIPDPSGSELGSQVGEEEKEKPVESAAEGQEEE